MSQSATRFLQQENIRLNNELEILQAEKQTLYSYLEVIKELYWTTQQITSEENLIYTLNKLLYKVMEVIGASDGSFSRHDETASELIFVLAHGDLGQQLPGYRIKNNMGIAGWVVENKEAIIVNNPRQDWRFSDIVDQEFSFFTNSILSVPVMRRNRFIGVIQMLNKRGNHFNEADVSLLLMLGWVAAIIIEEFEIRLEAGQADRDDFYY